MSQETLHHNFPPGSLEIAPQQPQWHALSHDEALYLSSRGSLYDPKYIGISAPLISVVAEINMGPECNRAVVVRHEEPGRRKEDRYFVVGLHGEGQDTVANGQCAEMIGIQPVVLTRAGSGVDNAVDLWAQAKNSGDTSCIRLVRAGDVIRIDDFSTTTSFARGAEIDDKPNYVSEYTMTGLRVADEKGHVTIGPEGQPYIRGYRVLDADTSDIEGTINIRSSEEWIITDSKRNPHHYRKLYEEFETRLPVRGKHSKITEEEVLGAIAYTMVDTMEYDPEFVRQTRAMIKSIDPEFKTVDWSYYAANHKGICPHMTTGAAWLVREAKAHGLLDGDMYTRARLSATRRLYGGHEWGRYESSNGTVYIIDPTNAARPFGKLSDYVHDASLEAGVYFEPGEREMYLAREQAALAVADTVEVKHEFTPTDKIKMQFDELQRRDGWNGRRMVGPRLRQRLEDNIDDLTAEAVRVLCEEVGSNRDDAALDRMVNYAGRVADSLKHFLISPAIMSELDTPQSRMKYFTDVVGRFNRVKINGMPDDRQKEFISFKKRFLTDTVRELANIQHMEQGRVLTGAQ